MLCIVCLSKKSNAEFSKEHVFPEAIGGHLAIGTVCKICNNKLGSTVDHWLIDHFFVQSERMLLGIGGKKGQVPNPLRRGTLADGSNRKVIYEVDVSGTPQSLRVETQKSSAMSNRGTEIISFSFDAFNKKECVTAVNKYLERNGYMPLSKEEINEAKKRRQIASPQISINKNIDLIEYKRGVLKIAYELSCHWLGDEYLKDSDGEPIRTCLLDDSSTIHWSFKYSIPGVIKLANDCPTFQFWKGNRAHIGFLMRDRENLVMGIRIFDWIEGKILVSRQAGNYAGFQDMFVSNDPISGKVRETPLAEELTRLGNDSKK